ncbi:hypothetical protein [Acinetobacter guerrae]|nr:hypothetical protein [Acinetobacter guerrae]
MLYLLGILRIILILSIVIIVVLCLSAWDNFFSPQHPIEEPEHFMQ